MLLAAALAVSTPSALAWQTESVDSTSSIGQYAFLVLDSVLNPGFAYLGMMDSARTQT